MDAGEFKEHMDAYARARDEQDAMDEAAAAAREDMRRLQAGAADYALDDQLRPGTSTLLAGLEPGDPKGFASETSAPTGPAVPPGDEVVDDLRMGDTPLPPFRPPPPPPPPPFGRSPSHGAPPPPPQLEKLRYLSINGFDRNWEIDPYRYRYTISSSDFGSSFTDVTAIQATSLIIPMEILHSRSAQLTPEFVPDKTAYQHEFGFAYQYVILGIEGLEGVYEGTNDNVRRAFCHFKYQRHYKAPNGRGYVQLDPLQQEIKRFFPAPLASLGNLSISILKPNGTPFNNSRDDYRVHKAEYLPRESTMLHVVLDKYYDRNEFYVGDTVVLRIRLDPEDARGTEEGAFATPAEVEALDRMQDFLGRKEGHEIIEVGAENETGYSRGFYIYAPGTLDQAVGELQLDEQAIAALVRYNLGVDEAGAARPSLGAVLNFSLQNALSFRVWTREPDASRLHTEGVAPGSGPLPSMFAAM